MTELRTAGRRVRGATRRVALAPVLIAGLTIGGCQNGSNPSQHGGARAPVTFRQPSPGEDAANRIVFWDACKDVVGLSDAELDRWAARGLGGFVCQTQYLADLGGDQRFVSGTVPGSAKYALQRSFATSRIVERAQARGIKIWLGVYLASYYTHATPLVDWFDDHGWSTYVIPSLTGLARAASQLGFAGVAFDEEQYNGGTWKWSYPGNTHTEAEVRAAVRQRGAQMMRAMVDVFPGVDIIDYGTYFPDGWNELLQQEVNHAPQNYAPFVQVNLWDGLTSVEGYGAIRFMDATLAKSWQLERANWDTALSYNDNRVFAYLSRHLSNWAYAAGHINLSPWAWVSTGRARDEGARDPAYVAAQLSAFRKWGMGGTFVNYVFSGLSRFDYTPYVTALQAAATPGVVDRVPPTVEITGRERRADVETISGTAHDDLAIHAVWWRTATASGAAQMEWVATGDYRHGYNWHINWSATIPATDQPVTITVADIKDNVTTLAIPVPGVGPPPDQVTPCSAAVAS
jgi:hypothetical protein